VAKSEPPAEKDKNEHKSTQQPSPEKDERDQCNELDYPFQVKQPYEEVPRTPSFRGGNRWGKRASIKPIADEQSAESESDGSDDDDNGDDASSIRTFDEDNLMEAVWLDLTLNDDDDDEQGPIKEVKPVVAPLPPTSKHLTLDSSDSSSDSEGPPIQLGRPQGFASCSNEQQVLMRRPVAKKMNSASLANSSPIKERMKLLQEKNADLTQVASPGRRLSPEKQSQESVVAEKLEVVPDLDAEPDSTINPAVPMQRLSLNDESRPDDCCEIAEETHQVSRANEPSAAPEPDSVDEKRLTHDEPGGDRPHEEAVEPAPAPVKRLSLDDTDSESSDDEPPMALTGRPGGDFFSSQQRLAAKRRPPPPSKAASKTLENVISLKDRMKFLNGLNAAKSAAVSGDHQEKPRRTASLMVSPSRGAASTCPRFQELKRLAMKTAHEIASDDENGDSKNDDKEMPRRSASMMYSPTKCVGSTNTTFQQTKDQSDDRDVGNDKEMRWRSASVMYSPTKCVGSKNTTFQQTKDQSDDREGDKDKEMPRRSASLMYSPTKCVGATNTTFQHTKENPDDGGDKNTVKVSLSHPRNSTFVVSPLKGGATNSRFQELKRLAMKSANEIVSDDDNAQAELPPRRNSTMMISPVKMGGVPNSRFQELKRLAMKSAHEIVSDDENGDGSRSQTTSPRRVSITTNNNSKFQQLRQHAMRVANESNSVDPVSPVRQVNAYISPQNKPIRKVQGGGGPNPCSKLVPDCEDEERVVTCKAAPSTQKAAPTKSAYESDDESENSTTMAQQLEQFCEASESSEDSDDSIERLRKEQERLRQEIEDTLHGSDDEDENEKEEKEDDCALGNHSGTSSDKEEATQTLVEPPPRRLTLDSDSDSDDDDDFPENFQAATGFAEMRAQARRRAPTPQRHQSQSLVNVTSIKDRKNGFPFK